MIRTNAHPVILTGSRDAPGRDKPGHNIIIDLARDLFDGDVFGWAMDLLYATQVLRMAYDSPRIGGGIDPALATNLPGLDGAREDCSTLAYIIGTASEARESNAAAGADEDYPHMGELENLDVHTAQDMIVHAEAVADRLITQCRIAGTDY